MRRNLINLALALVLVPATVTLVFLGLARPAPSGLAFDHPMHRVVMAVDEALKAEMASVTQGGCDFGFDVPPGMAVDDDSRFVIDIKVAPLPLIPGNAQQTAMVHLVGEVGFDGVARDGRSVHVTVKTDPFSDGTVLDFGDDPALSRLLAAKVTERLAHPHFKPGSAEDVAALKAYFSSTTGTPAMTRGQAKAALKPANGDAGLDQSDEDQ